MRINFYDTRLSESGGVMLVKEKALNHDAGKMDCPERITGLSKDILHLDGMAEEYLYMLALNSACRLVGVCMVSKGTVSASLASPREVYIRALLSGAVQIVLIHNHPSGNTTPTRQDISLTERMKKAGELLGVPLADHIIIAGGNDDYFSFCEAGLL